MSRRKTVLIVLVLAAVLFILAAGAVGALYVVFFRPSAPGISDESVLVIDLTEPIEERAEETLWAALHRSRPVNLVAASRLIRRAADDDRIGRAVLLVGPSPGFGWAAAAEIRGAVAFFRDSGKPVDAYIDAADDLGYSIAAEADRVFLSPSGLLLVDGLYGRVFFYKNLLGRADIRFDEIHAGSYKSAPESFTRESISGPAREQMDALLDDLFDEYLGAIAGARGSDAGWARRAVDDGPYLLPERAVEAGLADSVLALPDFERAAGIDEEGKSLTLAEYGKGSADGFRFGGAEFALIHVVGEILPGPDRREPVGGPIAGAETIIGAIREAAENDRYDAILLRVSSPGGSVGASDAIREEVVRAREKKPVVVSMGDVAASGAYWIASGADGIVAQPATITGSIGVFLLRPVLERFYERFGVGREEFLRGEHADIFSTPRAWNEEEKERIGRGIDGMYSLFLERVAEGRGMSVARVDSLAGGRVWSGKASYNNGLVDRIGGFDVAVRFAAELTGIDPDARVRLHLLPAERSLIERIREGDWGIARAGEDATISILESYGLPSAEILPFGPEGGPLRARIPYRISIR
ncbi:MAG: signal peptide peptidase SppA [Candidatus Eisenbacteria bacterium]|nr:signal peptide peptidase SppA [Candidatus Eisenbacteria bacterium]